MIYVFFLTYGCLIVARNYFCWNASYNTVIRDIINYNSVRSYNYIITNFNSSNNLCTAKHNHIISDYRITVFITPKVFPNSRTLK